MQRRAIYALGAASLAAACGIDVLGTLATEEPPDRVVEGGAEDRSVAEDDAAADADAEVTDASVDADAGGGCAEAGVTFADTFALLDGSVPGQYAWHSKTAPRPTTSGTHAVTLRLRKGTIEVRVDGTLVQSGLVASGFKGWFGFSASSGDTLGTFVVRAFTGTFYGCDDP